MDIGPGTRLGAYEILSALGAGGMGEVYRAHDTRLKRDVALKILPDRFAADADRLARFRREAEALASLNHPNIAAIYGLEDASSRHALVLELVDGPTLAERIAKGPIALDDIWPLAVQMTEALTAAHEKGIVHRDLKSANIKIARDGRVKILDFGLAKIFAAPPALDVSQSPTMVGTLTGSAGVILGTAAYMSPEQARGQPVDARADVWAFGCVLYEMLTGRPAFTGATITDILSAIVRSEPEWSALPGETPAAIRRLLRRCLAKDPNQRLHAIADARLEIADALNHADTAPTVEGASSSRRARLPWIIAGTALVAALAMSIAAFRAFRALPPPADAPELRLEVNTPPTTDPISMAISPDGRRLTFVATSDGTPRLWVRPLDTATAQPLPGTDGASYPFWSPDSRSLGFFAGGRLKRIDIGGGQPQILTNAAGGRGGTWSRDDVILFAVGFSNAPLLRVSASGGPTAPVTRLLPRQTNHRFPQFLPDGRRFLFFSQGSGDTQGVYLGALDSSETTRLASADTAAAYMPPDYVLYMRRGTLLAQRLDLPARALSGDLQTVADPVGWDGAIGLGAFSVSATGVVAHRASGPGRRELVWFDRTGKRAGVIGAPDEDNLQYPELSKDGSRIAIDRTVQNNRDIYLVDLGRGPRRLTFHAGIDATPVWSPDGGRIVFRSSRMGPYDLYQKSSSLEGTETPLYESPEDKIPSDWSPDGKLLLFTHQDPETGNDLFVLPLAGGGGGSKPRVVVQTRSDESQAAFSPDGHWVAYQSNEGGQFNVWLQPFPGPGGQRQVSPAGGASPRWRPDGRELYYLSPDAKLMAVPIRMQGATLEPGDPQVLFQTRLTTPFSGVAGNIRPQYDVAADGRFLMNITVEETTSPIAIILNWKPR
ncbi:MAG TPA: protein kinase [Vicinamibacterales bacterium]|nr:protein kinase [Vicinamibacterales bacterium]